jgi:pantetheine-phosphate adenylyltransferase
MKRKAIFPLSADPITNGHLDVIERMALLYDELCVLISVDHRKKYTFTTDERVSLVKQTTNHLQNVTVETCVKSYVAKYAKNYGAQVLLRGLRNGTDLEYEAAMANENHHICPDIEILWVPCRPEFMYVSSTVVKSHVGVDVDWEQQVARLVPGIALNKMKDKHMLERASIHWQDLMTCIGNPKGNETLFKKIVERYTESSRAHHTLAHIVFMLDELENVKHLTIKYNETRFGAWYHDVVNDAYAEVRPEPMYNEKRSAYYASLDMHELGLPNDFIKNVERLIMATAHKKLATEPDEMIITDLDLLILGQNEKVFDAYDANIRIEYELIPIDQYNAGRTRVLNHFLERPSIYATDFFKEKYETIARENLKRSIAILEN